MNIPSQYLEAIAIPDFSIIDKNENVLFILDAKRPDEDVSLYKQQLLGYANAAGVNFIVVTNSYQFYIYDGPEIIIECNSLEEIDKNFSLIKKILHKRNQRKRISLRMYELEKEFDSTDIIILPLSDYLKKNSQLDEKIIISYEIFNEDYHDFQWTFSF